MSHSADNRSLKYFLDEPDPVEAFALWVRYFSTPNLSDGFTAKRWLNQQIALIDQRISEQLDAVLHHPRLQRLESVWRGLALLTDEASTTENVKILLLDASWRDISRDMERAPDFEQSGLFHLVYNEGFGRPGAEPFSVLIGDYYVAHKPYEGHRFDDVFTLQGISRTATAAFCPFICSAAPQLFGLDSYDTLGLPIDLSNIFSQQEYLRWNAMRKLEDTRFIALTLPQVLMREPYDDCFNRHHGLRYREQVEGPDSSRYLWGNAGFALGAVLIREFAEVGWFSHIRGVPRDHQGGGLVTHFPALPYAPDSSPGMRKMVTPVLITDYLERQMSELGLVALCHCFQTPFAAFNNCPSLQLPKNYGSKAANANARISAMLQQVLCASRVAQYVKVIIRDKIGSYISAADCERALQQWLDQYTSGREDLSWDMMARYPLREARVRVADDPAKPGHYQSVIHLKTHYTVDHLVSELKLTTAMSQTEFGQVS